MKKEKVPNIWKDKENYYLKVLNNNWYKLLIKLENLISVETMKFYQKKGIITLHLPVTTGSISSPMGRGSDSLPVKINLEGVNTYLADSMQFLLEYGCRLSDTGVYYIMPSFRGEKADKRHLCQFYHSEAEIIGTLEDVIILVEEYIRYLAQQIILQLEDDLNEIIGNIDHIKLLVNSKNAFPRITFDEAEKELLKIHESEIEDYIIHNNGWRNITPKGEQELIRLHGGIVWITNYDLLSVPFYQKKDSMIAGTARNADLLMGYGEIVGCGERHFDASELINSLKFHQVDIDEYQWYIKLKKEFPLNTSGFGMGIERFLMWVLQCDDIRNLQLCLRFNGEQILP